MSGIKKILFALLFIAFNNISFCQNIYTYRVEHKERSLPFGLTLNEPTLKPKISIALSGGGARGFSQVGILKAFEENNIPIKSIIGTSMGSIIGGLYSAGFNSTDLDSIITYTDWKDLLSFARENDRRELFLDQKITEDKAVITLRLKGLKPIIPTAINSGQKLANYLNLLTIEAPVHSNNFNELYYPFKAVCTDLLSGKAIVIENGSLSQALRASSSVSFFLPPVRIDSLILMDGGLAANIPVEIASKYPHDYIVAVNTTSGLHSEDELANPLFVADQVVSIPMKLLNERQLTFSNLVITPEIGNKLSTDYSNIDSLINEGYHTGLKYINIIKSNLNDIYRINTSTDLKYFHNLLYPSNANELEKLIYNKYGTKDSVSSSDILMELTNIYDEGYYKEIKAKIVQDSAMNTIRVEYEKNPFVNEVFCRGNSLINQQAIDSIFFSVKRNPFNAKKLEKSLIDLMKLYRKEGYALAEISSFTFNVDTGIINIDIDEGYISKVVIEGNKYTNNFIISRELSFNAGEVFSVKDVERSLRNLRNSSLFDDVVFAVQKQDDQNIIDLKVQERISSLIRLGFKIDNESKSQFNIDIRDENLFGRGIELGLNVLGGERNRAYVIEQKSNRILNTYFTYKINAYYKFDDAYIYSINVNPESRRIERNNVGEYRQIYYGASIAAGSQFGRFGTMIFKGTYEFNDVKNKQNNLLVPKKIKIVSLKGIMSFDTQNTYPYPTAGFLFTGTYETAQKILGASLGYTNIWFDYKSYFTYKEIHTISPRIMMGFGDKTLPLTQQYSLGGQNSFYGMFRDEDRGRQIFLSSLEYIYKTPVVLYFDTYLKLRYDIGSVWDVQESIRFKDLRHGLGAAISLSTPIGPAEFAVGKSMLIKSGELGKKFYFGETTFYFSIGFYY